MSEKLCRLTNIGRALIDDSFLNSSNEIRIMDADAWESLDEDVNIPSLESMITPIIGISMEKPFLTDSKLATGIHKKINLARRYAMDTAVWHYLSCVLYPEYVRYRWTNKIGKVSNERFLGGIKRNAFARLWWAAEILHQEGDYSLIEVCFENQDLYEAIFGRSMSKYPLAAKVFIKTIKDEKRQTIRDTAKAINLLLSTFVLEDLTEQYFQSLIESQILLNQK